MKCDPLPGNSLFPGSLESSLTNRDRTREVNGGKGKVQKVSGFLGKNRELSCVHRKYLTTTKILCRQEKRLGKL